MLTAIFYTIFFMWKITGSLIRKLGLQAQLRTFPIQCSALSHLSVHTKSKKFLRDQVATNDYLKRFYLIKVRVFVHVIKANESTG